jgi:hypothetical protein
MKEMEWRAYQWIVRIDSCPHCHGSHIMPKTSTSGMRDAIGEMIKSVKKHKKRYCSAINKKDLFEINVNIKWNNKSPHAYKSTWEKHKIYV